MRGYLQTKSYEKEGLVDPEPRRLSGRGLGKQRASAAPDVCVALAIDLLPLSFGWDAVAGEEDASGRSPSPVLACC